MADWYVARQGQQQGPFNDDTFRQMIAQNAVGGDDAVWREGMSQWLPARQVPELANLFKTAQPQAVSYSQPFREGGSTMLTDRGLDMLRLTKPWVRLVSILIFVAAGLMGIGGAIVVLIGLVGVGASQSSGGSMGGAAMAGLGLMYLVMAALYFMPGLYLFRYASRIAELVRARREDLLEQALEAQKSFWKFVGVLTVIMIVLWLAMVSVMVLGGIFAASNGGTIHSSTTIQHVP